MSDVIYAINSGNLLRYKDLANDGTEYWASASGQIIGHGGWDGFKSVFAGSGGVIYGIKDDNLWWYKDLANDGIESWAKGGGQKIGRGGWNAFQNVFAAH